MQNTPKSMRKQVVILGNVNSGKSQLFNALTGQNKAIVSDQMGTTTDPVSASMELVPHGPIVLYDTAGFEDQSTLGKQRLEKTQDILRRADAAICVVTPDNIDNSKIHQALENIKLPSLLVFTKCDLYSDDKINQLKQKYSDAVFMPRNTEQLQSKLSHILTQEQKEKSMIGDLLSPLSSIIMVVKMDSASPKGRLILPQVQLIRDCVDHNIMCTIATPSELSHSINNMKKVDLVVTDSQLFNEVNSILPQNILLTSVSMLLARQKGNFDQLLLGTQKIPNLKSGSKILMLEGCTHNSTHEDIGKNKIPNLLMKKTGLKLEFEHFTGYDFPKNLSEYDMAIQCGSCMINQKEISNRLDQMKNNNFPVTNYGMVLAWGNGILDRSCEIFQKEII